MPEGHTLHRLARRFARELGARSVRASSPQGRFAAGAALLDGGVLERTEAHGKHLWLGFTGERWLHVHLGLYGTWTFGEGDPEPPRGAVRLRLAVPGTWADLRGPTICEVQTRQEKDAVHTRLGDDPLRRDADAARFVERVRRSRAPVAGLLMQQDVIAGIGNVYRAEALFRARLDPFRPGRDLPEDVVHELWGDVSVLLRDGVRRGRIVTTMPGHRQRPGRLHQEDAHYVYRRTGLPCRLCQAPVVTEVLAARHLYWCPRCQAG
jgi:endonuclease-8